MLCIRYTQRKTRCKNPARENGKLCKVHADAIREALFVEIQTRKVSPEDIFKKVIDCIRDKIPPTPGIVTYKLRELSDIPQPVQRSPEWFAMRKGMITASELASCIYYTEYLQTLSIQGVFYVPDKLRLNTLGCNPYESHKKYIERKSGVMSPPFTGNVFTEWGKCYEPVATSVYSYIKDTVVYEYGLLPHPEYTFLGASPDGISSDGVMLEVKCPYTDRKVGIPVIYYWVQMQLQMEVANIYTCDFFDCRIREFNPNDGPPGVYEYTGVVLEMTDLSKPIDADNRYSYYYPKMFNDGNVLAGGDSASTGIISVFDQDVDIDNWVLSLDRGTKLDIMYNRVAIRKRYYYVDDYAVSRIRRDRYWFNVMAIHDIRAAHAKIVELAADPEKRENIESIAAARSAKRKENAAIKSSAASFRNAKMLIIDSDND